MPVRSENLQSLPILSANNPPGALSSVCCLPDPPPELDSDSLANKLRIRYNKQILIALLALAFALTSRATEPPNLLLVLADDMGYSDLGCFGSEIPTPHLDSLAREGVRLTRCRNASMCVVTRASLMTGKWWPSALPSFKETVILP
ncbi:MAG: sulfatase-like hydrolase/transferase, partial [Verrucomicrobiales bacterium]